MTQSQTGIKVNNLPTSQSLTSDNMLMALTDNANNTVSLVSLENLENSLVSSTANNGLSNDENGLFVPNIGNLSSLQTTNKTSIVAAINENATKISQPVTYNAAGSGTINLSDNSIYRITPVGNITFSLPSVSNLNIYHQILIQLDLSTVYQINLGTNYYFDGSAPSFVQGNYDIIYSFDAALNNWVCGAIYKGQ